MSAASDHSLTGNRIEYRADRDRRVVRRYWSSATRAAWLGASREAELAAHRLADRAGLAPRITDVDLGLQWIELEWVDGAPVRVDPAIDSSTRSALWSVLARLRHLDPIGVPHLDVPSRVDILLERLRLIEPLAWSTWESRWGELRRRAAESTASTNQLCLVHGDLTSGNVLQRTDGRLFCIDWEYAHAGHPLEDLAGFLVGSSALLAEWQLAQTTGAAQPDWWPAATFHELGCHGRHEQIRLLNWWIEARGVLDGVWMALAAHSAGNARDA
ncbi:MAG: hypothetical protein RLY56_314 [Pseudomonadota bacterium]|jgi:aminoglycoside phosphotransferase (APT) family kinase protein